MRISILNKESGQKGSVLLEALVSMLIFAFGVMGIALFQATLMARDKDSEYRTQAAMYASSISSLAASEPNSALCFVMNGATATVCANADAQNQAANWANDYSANMPGAILPVVDLAADGTFTVTLKWKRLKDNVQHNLVYVTRVGV